MEKHFVTKCSRSMSRNVGKVKPEVKSTMPPVLESIYGKIDKKLKIVLVRDMNSMFLLMLPCRFSISNGKEFCYEM